MEIKIVAIKSRKNQKAVKQLQRFCYIFCSWLVGDYEEGRKWRAEKQL